MSSLPSELPHISSKETSPKSDCAPIIPDDELSLSEKDRRHLLHIFPDEIWELIYEKLDNPIHLENLSNSSLYFRNLLSPRGTQFLFHGVWEVLGNGLGKNAVWPSLDWKQDWCQEILKLRLVCGTWNAVIENHYQNHQLHFQLQADENDTSKGCIATRFLYANLSTTNRDLITHLAPTHANSRKRSPFLGRSVKMGLSYLSITFPNHDIINEILKNYGHHIWYCTIIFILDFGDVDYVEQFYSTIQELLRSMPNLKVLRLKNYAISSSRMSQRVKKLMQVVINLLPLPTLEHLQMISLESCSAPWFFNELIRSNGHVSRLDVDVHESGYRTFQQTQNLKMLAASFPSKTAFLKMNRIRTVGCQLTELHLNLQTCNKTYIYWQKVFKVLEKKFKNTLTELDLKLPEAKKNADKKTIYRKSHTFKLNLPNVRKLTLETRNLSCWDFLLPMSNSLVELKVKMNLDEDYEELIGLLEKLEAETKNVVKLLSCLRGEDKKTNVWKLFPKLENVWFGAYSNIVGHEFRRNRHNLGGH